jgi:phosphoglycolate phosphatase
MCEKFAQPLNSPLKNSQSSEDFIPMLFQAVLFDLDGTLLDTLDDLADTANAALASFNFPTHPKDAYRYFVGDGLRVLVERIMPKTCSELQIADCEASFKRMYAVHWADKSCPYTGIETMLAKLREMGLKLAVLSNKPDDFTSLCVNRYFPENTFTCVQGQREGVPKKPDPAGALIVADRLGMKPAEILYVGDTATDMKTGKGAGMVTAGVLWGFREIHELETNGADYIIRDPQEIVKLCRQ